MASTTNDSFDAKGTEYRNDLEQRRSHNPNGDLGHESRQIEPQSKGFYGHIGNPGVLGLAAHAVTLMLLGTQFMGWRGVVNPQVYIGNLYFMAGLYMFTTAQWCLVKGETFAYCVFGVFSGFYLSFGAILTPYYGVTDAYSSVAGTAGADTAALYQSLATFLLVWNGAFICIFIASLRTNIALVIVFAGVFLGVFCLAGMYLQLAEVAIDAGKGSATMATALSKAGGAFLFMSASSGFYLVFVQLTESVDFPFTLPVGDLTPYWPKKKMA